MTTAEQDATPISAGIESTPQPLSTQAGAAAQRESDAWSFALLLLLAGGMEGVLVVFVRRLSLARFPQVVPTPEPLATILGGSADERALTWFVVAMGAMVLCQVFAYAVALRIRNPRYGLGALVVAALLIATMIPVYPGGAHDVEHNIVDARTLWVYHDNPISTPPTAHPDDPFVQQLFDWQSTTSSYGPVWYVLAGAPLPFTGNGLVRNVVGQKILVSLFLLGTVALIYLLMKRWRPRGAVAAVVLLGWSPLLLWEIPGNAHNDIVMMFFAVAALYAVLRRWWLAVFPLLALAVATKFIMLLLVPLLLFWLLLPNGFEPAALKRALAEGEGSALRRLYRAVDRRSRVPLRTLAASLGAGVGVFLLVYAPFLFSSFTLANHGALQDRFIASPTSLTISFLMQYTDLNRAEDVARAIAITCFVIGYLYVLWRCRGSFETLLSCAFWATFLTLVLPTWWWWPWYLAWLMPLAAALAGRKTATVALVFSASALLFYAIYYFRFALLNPQDWYANQFVIVGAVFGPVALYLLGAFARRPLTFSREDTDEDLPSASLPAA